FWVPHRMGGGAPTLAEANRMDAEEAARKAEARRTGTPGLDTGAAEAPG
ncbi:1-acyl-sn-glycerol-3-phosphate acyltransferase, partial [Mycobacterium sp. ITM-2017-0098]